MIDMELDLLRENPSWLVVLRAYETVFEELAAESQAEKARPTDKNVPTEEAAALEDGEQEADDAETASPAAEKIRRPRPWAPRLTTVEDVDSEELSRIHGRLIAYGLLKCDLADRSAGVVYQLTAEARKSLEALAGHDPAVESADSTDDDELSIPA